MIELNGRARREVRAMLDERIHDALAQIESISCPPETTLVLRGYLVALREVDEVIFGEAEAATEEE